MQLTRFLKTQERVELRTNNLVWFDDVFPEMAFSIPLHSIISAKQIFGIVTTSTKLYDVLKEAGHSPPDELYLTDPVTDCIEVTYRPVSKHQKIVRIPSWLFSRELLLELIKRIGTTASLDASIYQLSKGQQTRVELKGHLHSLLFIFVLLLIVILLHWGLPVSETLGEFWIHMSIIGFQ